MANSLASLLIPDLQLNCRSMPRIIHYFVLHSSCPDAIDAPGSHSHGGSLVAMKCIDAIMNTIPSAVDSTNSGKESLVMPAHISCLTNVCQTS